MTRIAVVGGGLAGLTCAKTLENSGFAVDLFEQSDRVGGKLRTDTVRGFRVDRGFQVYFPAYLNAKELLDHKQLDLKFWKNGARVWTGDAWNLIDADRPLSTAISPLLGLKDKLLTLRLRQFALGLEEADRNKLKDETAETFLRGFGLSDAYLDRFARPFFGGIFLDRSLSVSARQFLFVFAFVARGGAATPAKGIEAIPQQLADGLKNTRIRTACDVVEVTGASIRVLGESAKTYAATIVCAGHTGTENLINNPVVTGIKSSVCLTYAVQDPLVIEPYLLLNGSGQGLINEVAPLSIVSPALAPNGGHLFSATVLGQTEVDPDAIEAELRTWFPAHSFRGLTLLKVDEIRDAQFAQPPGFQDSRPPYETATPNLWLAGDFSQNCSIDGAMNAGHQCAQAVARRYSA